MLSLHGVRRCLKTCYNHSMDIDINLVKNIIISASNVVLLPQFNAVERSYTPDGSVVTEADLLMQYRIKSELKLAYPDIELLGEEMTKEQQQVLLSSGKALWCLDPVDGTSNFAAGIP